jgi:hypothetical protein
MATHLVVHRYESSPVTNPAEPLSHRFGFLFGGPARNTFIK